MAVGRSRIGPRSKVPQNAQLRARLGELLRRLSSDLQEVSRHFGDQHALHPTDVRALVVIMEANREGEQIGPSALGERLGISSASATALVDRLESVGHVKRERDEHDRRRVFLHVGDDAVRYGGQYFGSLQRRIDGAISDFSPAELLVVERYLNAAIGAVEEHLTD